MPNAFSVNVFFYIHRPRVVARAPTAGLNVSQRLRRYFAWVLDDLK